MTGFADVTHDPHAGATGGERRPVDAAEPPIRLVHVLSVPFCLHFVAGQVAYMTYRRFDVTVVSSPGDELEAFGEREGVAVHALEMPRRITPLHDIIALWRLVVLLRRIRPRLVHSHTPKGGLLGTLAGWLARVPVRVYHMHGLPFVTTTGGQRTLLRLTERVSCAFANEVLCVSHSLREVAVREGICPPEKIKVLLGGSVNGVDATGGFDPDRWRSAGAATRQQHSIPPDALVIGFVGRIVRDEGLAELVAAWQTLREEFPRLHMLVVGGFEPRDPVPAEVAAALLDDPRIHMIGWQKTMAAYYAAMDVFVLPSHREGLSTVLLEAAAMELPAVASRIPGCFDVIHHGETGMLFPAGDGAALAEALRPYLQDAALRRRHGLEARTRVLRDFRRDAIWDALHAEYRRLLG